MLGSTYRPDGYVIGSCSICGGDVVAVGARGWWSVAPPPPPTCRSCGAVAQNHRRTIPMVPAAPAPDPSRVEIRWDGTGTSP